MEWISKLLKKYNTHYAGIWACPSSLPNPKSPCRWGWSAPPNCIMLGDTLSSDLRLEEYGLPKTWGALTDIGWANWSCTRSHHLLGKIPIFAVQNSQSSKDHKSAVAHLNSTPNWLLPNYQTRAPGCQTRDLCVSRSTVFSCDTLTEWEGWGPVRPDRLRPHRQWRPHWAAISCFDCPWNPRQRRWKMLHIQS